MWSDGFVPFLSDPGLPGVQSMGPVLSHWLTEPPFADLTYVTLADEDTNFILTDNANRAFQGNVAMWVTKPGGQLWNQAMQVTLPNDQLLNWFATNQKCILKRNTNQIWRNTAHLNLRNATTSQSRFGSQTEQTLSTCVLILISSWRGWTCSYTMQVAFYLAGEITQVKESIPWVRCASGNV